MDWRIICWYDVDRVTERDSVLKCVVWCSEDPMKLIIP